MVSNRTRGYLGVPLSLQYKRKTSAEKKRARRREKRLAANKQQKN